MTRYVFWDQIPARKFLDITIEDIDNEEVVIVRDSGYDVTARLDIFCTIKCSDGNKDGGISFVNNNDSVALWNDGTNVLTLAVAANGQATLQRTAGAVTFDITLRAIWI